MSRRGRTTAAVAAVLTAGAAAAAVFVAGLPGGEAGAQPESDMPAATADVREETLVDTEEHDGELGFGDPAALTTKLAGTVTSIPGNGATVKRGEPLYSLDNDPVVLLYGSLPAYRDLSPGVEGADVKQFEKNLRALGYRGFTVDDEYTSATADAVEEWQDDLGISETGTVPLGRVIFQPSAVRVESGTAAPGDTAQPGTEILKISGVRRVVTVDLEVADQRLAKKGAKVDVTLPDGKVAPGRVADVESTIETAENPAEEDTTVLTLTITFDKPVDGLDGAGVTVGFTSSQRENVLTVPVNALLALAEGGYGLEVVDGGATRIVAVETGLFANGRVEVSGGGLTEGMKVGVPE
ncbi:peptidoglycan-binding protein [Actinoplanes sp. NPDC023936]|uniref:efflux RND transporter periplasmic adaptor subunit n=1 Tax=Actinoplanes sp. NPDC023936 TaxID=3154910 RepID=UPI0033F36BB8